MTLAADKKMTRSRKQGYRFRCQQELFQNACIILFGLPKIRFFSYNLPLHLSCSVFHLWNSQIFCFLYLTILNLFTPFLLCHRIDSKPYLFSNLSSLLLLFLPLLNLFVFSPPFQLCQFHSTTSCSSCIPIRIFNPTQ